MKILHKIKGASLYPLARFIITYQSLISGLKSFGKKPITHFERPYSGEKILLLALYEKGILRSDIFNLLGAAKEAGIYIIAINTLKVINPDDLKNTIDCYIERPNFGRDFGSYKTGFLHVFKKKWEQECPRLLMLNDSLFYSKKNLPSFLDKMMSSEVEVLGSTENYEHEYHLGSFTIAYSGTVLRHAKLKKYWKNYKNSDIRPKVIENGEKKLSRTLKRCVSSPNQMCALFNLNWVSDQINKDRKLLNKISEISREPSSTSTFSLGAISIKSIAIKLKEKYIHYDLFSPNKNSYLNSSNSLLNNKVDRVFFADSLDGLVKEVASVLGESNEKVLEDIIYLEAINSILESFVIGSEIHQNGVLLHYLGVPLVKLDAIYRGVLSIGDIEKISSQMSKEEKNHFKSVMYSKQYGGDMLIGWKRAAFNLGML